MDDETDIWAEAGFAPIGDLGWDHVDGREDPDDLLDDDYFASLDDEDDDASTVDGGELAALEDRMAEERSHGTLFRTPKPADV